MYSVQRQRIHVLGLGLSYDAAYDIAIDQGISKRYLNKHDVDDALNTHFSRRGYAAVCMQLPEIESRIYAKEEYDYCLITNWRVVEHDHTTSLNHHNERPHADGWTKLVAEALLPGADYKTSLMRMTFEEWGSAPGLIRAFYKHQAGGDTVQKVSGYSPDQTNYRPILKARTQRLRWERAAGSLVAWPSEECKRKQMAANEAKVATTAMSSDEEWNQKTPTAPAASSQSGGDYFSCKPIPAPSASTSSSADFEDNMKTPTQSSVNPTISVPLSGCQSGPNSDKFTFWAL